MQLALHTDLLCPKRLSQSLGKPGKEQTTLTGWRRPPHLTASRWVNPSCGVWLDGLSGYSAV
jgi:hypothetical protein